ncbi:GntR family transcriptional regulator [Microcella alkalica]|uniref:DNA-binding GntR family transcriptional regulator n=1 Tax=Microcella alkalica TaxID=355930 RepID=A0A839E919_9MICO|nr:GntR family transcriptional regulator [Microcella alkalica]MBA8848270.1 DNA-binding GntR family transcriptional regulator [Microcella alkalica]
MSAASAPLDRVRPPRVAAPLTRDGNASARVADALREAIVGGEYPPGSRIRQEEIAERFGASRVPVREALKALEADGLVTLVANTGAWVTRLSLAECEEVYQTRERVEPLLLRYSAPHLDDAALDELERLAERMAETADVEEFLRLDREFHQRSYAGADTLVLGDLVRRLWNTTQPYRRAYTLMIDAHSQRIVHDEHHMLVTALRDRDFDTAERVIEGHIRRTRRLLASHPEVFETLPAIP